MKKLTLSLIGIFLLSVVAFAAKPPVEVVNAFNAKFPGAVKVAWAKENAKEWEANFVADGKKMSANFSVTGEWLETEAQIEIAELPTAVAQAIKGSHPTGKVTSAYRIESSKDGVKFEADVRTGKKVIEVFLKEDGSPVH